eukprot:scaffold1954_cov268-Pinguiococcus_pyrenoidosus.AAC.240
MPDVEEDAGQSCLPGLLRAAQRCAERQLHAALKCASGRKFDLHRLQNPLLIGTPEHDNLFHAQDDAIVPHPHVTGRSLHQHLAGHDTVRVVDALSQLVSVQHDLQPVPPWQTRGKLREICNARRERSTPLPRSHTRDATSPARRSSERREAMGGRGERAAAPSLSLARLLLRTSRAQKDAFDGELASVGRA